MTTPPSSEFGHTTHDKLREAGWATPADLAAAREEGRAEVRAQVAALRLKYLPMVDQGRGSYLVPRVVVAHLAEISTPPVEGAS